MEVTLHDTGDGTVQVVIDGAGRLGAGRALLFGVAANAQDYLVVLRPGGAVLGRWDGAAWVSFPHRALAPKAGGERFAFSLAFDDLGARTFDYWFAAVRGGDVEAAPPAAEGAGPPTLPALARGRFTSLAS